MTMGILEIQVRGSYLGKTFSLNLVDYIYVVGSHFCLLLGYRFPFWFRNPPFFSFFSALLILWAGSGSVKVCMSPSWNQKYMGGGRETRFEMHGAGRFLVENSSNHQM